MPRVQLIHEHGGGRKDERRYDRTHIYFRGTCGKQGHPDKERLAGGVREGALFQQQRPEQEDLAVVGEATGFAGGPP